MTPRASPDLSGDQARNLSERWQRGRGGPVPVRHIHLRRHVSSGPRVPSHSSLPLEVSLYLYVVSSIFKSSLSR